MVKSVYFTIVFFFTGNCLLYAQSELIDHERFLANHLCDENREIYVFSEDNRLGSSVELRYTLITSLNQKCGVRNIITGSGTSETWLFNQYLASGDTSLLMNTD